MEPMASGWDTEDTELLELLIRTSQEAGSGLLHESFYIHNMRHISGIDQSMPKNALCC